MSAYEHAVAGGYDGTLEEFEEQLNAVVNIDEAEELGIDGNPIKNSNNLITSGGVYSALNGKVDKVSGKGLSTNDYDTTAKAKVDAIPSTPKYTDTIYDDTAIKSRVSTIENKEAGWDAKQDAIPDLATIRSGAALGATALQSVPSEYVTETELNNHHDSTKQDKSTLEQDVADKGFTKIEYVNITGTSGNLDAETYAILSDTTKEVVVVYNNNYLKRIQVKSEYVRFSMTRNRNVTPGQNETVTLIAYNGAPNYSYNFKYEIIDQTYYVIMTTDPELSFAENNLGLNLSAIDMSQLDNSKSEFITLADVDSHHDSTKQDVISDLSTIRSGASKGATAVQPEAGKGLFSGDYNDLTNKPTSPVGVEEVTFDDTATFEEIAEASDAGKKCYWYGTIIYGSGVLSMAATVTLPLISIVNNAMQKSAVFNGTAKLSGMGGQAFASVVSTCTGVSTFTPTPGWSHSADPLQYKLTAGNNITISENTISAEGCLVLDYEEGNEQYYHGDEINNIINNNKSVIVRAVLPDGSVAYYTPCMYESSEGIMYFSCMTPSQDAPQFIYLDSDSYFGVANNLPNYATDAYVNSLIDAKLGALDGNGVAY